MYSGNDKISKRQLQILIILDVLGISVITLPGYNARILGENGWFLSLGGGIFAAVSVVLICSLSDFLRTEGFFKGLSSLFGRPAAFFISAGLIIKLIFSMSADIRTFSEAARLWLLPKTPLAAIIAVTLLPCFIGALHSYETRARLGEVIIFIVIIPLLLVYVPYLFRVDYGEVLKNIYADRRIYLKGSFFNCFAFTGIEFLLLSLGYINDPADIKLPAAGAVIFSAALVAIVNFVTISLLGAPLAGGLDFPGAEIMDVSVFSKGKGAVMMSFFYLTVVIYAVGAIFFGGELLRDITGGKRSLCKAAAALLGFALSLMPRSMDELVKVSAKINFTFGTAYCFVLPVVLLFILKFGKGKRL